MAFLIIEALNETAFSLLRKWANGKRREEIKKYFIREIGNGAYLTEANGEMITLALALKERTNGKIEIFVAKSLLESDVPKEIKEVKECLIVNPKKRKELEKVKEMKVRCSLHWKKK